MSFAAAYTAPVVVAFELPAQSSFASPLPALALPAVAFPSLEVPTVSPPVPQAAMPERSTAPVPTPRASQRLATPAPARPVPLTRAAPGPQVPVVTDQYTLDPAATTTAPATAAADPFANAPVVEDAVGALPAPLPVAGASSGNERLCARSPGSSAGSTGSSVSARLQPRPRSITGSYRPCQ